MNWVFFDLQIILALEALFQNERVLNRILNNEYHPKQQRIFSNIFRCIILHFIL